MKENIKQKVLSSIGKIYEKSTDCKLNVKHFEKIDKELLLLSEYFGTTKMQAFFIAVVLSLNYKGDSVDYNDLIKFFDCNPMQLLHYSDDIEQLCNSGIFIKQRSQHRVNLARANDQLTINEKISEAILESKPMPEVAQFVFNDLFEVLESFNTILEQRSEKEISTRMLLHKADKIISQNRHFPLIQKVYNFKLSASDTFLYLYLIWETISGNEAVDLSKTIEYFYDTPSKRVKYTQELLKGEHYLIKNDLIEIVEAMFLNNSDLKLTKKSINILTECNVKLYNTKQKRDDVIMPADITPRKLVFHEEEMKQLSLLNNLLKEVNLKKTMKRLKDKGLPNGVTVMLFGAPGTGKTESVLQIAKKTNREIMKVDISQTKSMWFGESEKLIKRVFTKYKSFAQECKRTPILLFNEADAIISKRKDSSISNVAQTENTIQNIILEELENFDGILIATTNLVNNIDKAFERRFLFKIEFNKPDIKTKTKIWKLKIPSLKLSDCEILSSPFDFSGGQIDNIVRKTATYEAIHGKSADIKHIIEFCKEETFYKDRVRIGYIS
ncbi:MAG: ATP-binding protein [Bacteroidetes bacterium]|nr:ATP-binding protein [Bacteroidota bacterium]